ncbi:hypothetical protein [Lacihabitans soyangensis]|uniref:Uncharacterized protein n=1 Tax=Lacihabitans soyangensis TaxID=869394 RepID=A0AAE3KV53_9BACT|nr:hypothetical protein [Lacihabitans soyangensis]MCP9765654.1 hypothetical protein [Lacihabitans soyangensis]
MKTKPTLLSILSELPKLTLDPKIHQVNLIPNGINIHFIDSKYQEKFEEYAKGKNKQIKLINYGQAAINLTFYEKHKYKIEKDPIPEEVFEALLKRCDDLNEFINQGYLFEDNQRNERQTQAKEQLLKIQHTIDNFHNYEFAISNYYRNFIYWYVSFRYRLEDGSLDFASQHLLNSEKDRFGKTTLPKINIIFIDTDYISVHTPYQNKKIEEYLKQFETQLDLGLRDIFVKEKITSQ